MKYNFIASGKHYIDHMLPIWQKLPDEYKNYFYVHNSIRDYAKNKNIDKLNTYPNGYFLNQNLMSDYKKHKDLHILVASYRDLDYADIGIKNLILMEHGAGQIYTSDNSAWNRSGYNKNTVLLLATNEILADRFRQNNDIRVEVVGCPKLDQYIMDYNKSGKIAISFHFDCKALPETRSSFEHYKAIIPKVNNELNLCGHWHPVWGDTLKKFYINHGIQTISNFDTILRECDLYIVDNSSTLFEFAAIGKPVILLNNPHYRKDIEHGMRFWEFADIGYQVEEPEDLIDTIKRALKDPKYKQKRRQQISNIVYPYLGNSTERFVNILKGLGG